MKELDDLYWFLQARGLVESKTRSATDWLGRSPSYYRTLTAIRAEPPGSTLVALAIRLCLIAREWMKSPRLAAQGRNLLALASSIKWAGEVKCLANVPQPRMRRICP